MLFFFIMNFSQLHHRTIIQRNLTQKLCRERLLTRRLLETINRLPDNAVNTRARFRFLSLEARLNEAIIHSERTERRISLIGSVSRFDSNGNNTNTSNGNNTNTPNGGDIVESNSSNTDTTIAGSSSNRILFTLFVSGFLVIGIFLTLALFQFDSFQGFQLYYHSFTSILLSSDFSSLLLLNVFSSLYS